MKPTLDPTLWLFRPAPTPQGRATASADRPERADLWRRAEGEIGRGPGGERREPEGPGRPAPEPAPPPPDAEPTPGRPPVDAPPSERPQTDLPWTGEPENELTPGNGGAAETATVGVSDDVDHASGADVPTPGPLPAPIEPPNGPVTPPTATDDGPRREDPPGLARRVRGEHDGVGGERRAPRAATPFPGDPRPERPPTAPGSDSPATRVPAPPTGGDGGVEVRPEKGRVPVTQPTAPGTGSTPGAEAPPAEPPIRTPGRIPLEPEAPRPARDPGTTNETLPVRPAPDAGTIAPKAPEAPTPQPRTPEIPASETPPPAPAPVRKPSLEPAPESGTGEAAREAGREARRAIEAELRPERVDRAPEREVPVPPRPSTPGPVDDGPGREVPVRARESAVPAGRPEPQTEGLRTIAALQRDARETVDRVLRRIGVEGTRPDVEPRDRFDGDTRRPSFAESTPADDGDSRGGDDGGSRRGPNAGIADAYRVMAEMNRPATAPTTTGGSESAPVTGSAAAIGASLPAAGATSTAAAQVARPLPIAQLAETVAARARAIGDGGTLRVRFALEPSDLGLVRIQIDTRGETAHIRIAATQEHALAAIQGRVQEMTAHLHDAGFRQADVQVSLEQAGSAGAWGSMRGDAGRDAARGAGSRGRGRRDASIDGVAATGPGADAPPSRPGLGGRLDRVA